MGRCDLTLPRTNKESVVIKDKKNLRPDKNSKRFLCIFLVYFLELVENYSLARYAPRKRKDFGAIFFTCVGKLQSHTVCHHRNPVFFLQTNDLFTNIFFFPLSEN